MLGDDVVDLRDPETLPGSSQPRFDARVFTPGEIAAIARSRSPAKLRWTFWAAKEAAYKAARREDPAVVFSPRRFAVSPHGEIRARVTHEQRSFDVALEAGDGWVHAIARAIPRGGDAPRAAPLWTGVALVPERWRDLPDGPSLAVRELVAATLARALGLEPRRLAILREGRLPRLLYGRDWFPAVLSLSHHGRFAAFACSLAGPRGAPEAVL